MSLNRNVDDFFMDMAATLIDDCSIILNMTSRKYFLMDRKLIIKVNFGWNMVPG